MGGRRRPPEIARGLAPAGFDSGLDGELARACLKELVPRIAPEVSALRELAGRRRRHVVATAFVLSVFGL